MKKAQFMELDVLVAILLLAGGVILIKTLFVYSYEAPQIDKYSEDAVTLLEEQRMSELDPTYLIWIANNYPAITIDLNASIARQITILLIDGHTTLADNLAQTALDNIIPQGYHYNVSIISNTQQYDITSSNEEVEHTIAQSRILLTGLEVGQPVVGYSGTAFLSNGRTTRSAYAYLGGFVGQGNISVNLTIPRGGTALEVYVEGDFHDNFTFILNGYDCGDVQVPSQPDAFTDITTETLDATCAAQVREGENTVTIVFTGDNLDNMFVGGGFIRINYDYDNPYEPKPTTKKYKFPDISGIFNLYDSIYVPGELTNMRLRLHYLSNHTENNNTIFFSIGNTVIMTDNESTTEQVVTEDNAALSALLDYGDFQNQTVPIRFGYENVSVELLTESISDSVLITDVSGSMDWNFTYTGSSIPDPNIAYRRNCDNVSINAPNSTRLSVAKCAGKDFAKIILNNSENRVGLVSYSSGTSTLDLTNILDDINTTIGTSQPDYPTGYRPSGSTCIACGIYEATQILVDQSTEEKLKFIVVMSDGEANRCDTHDGSRYNCGSSSAAQQAIDYAQIAHDTYNITIFSVAFGVVGWENLYDIAAVDNISHFYNGTNATSLRDIYRQIAQQIVSTGRYNAQIVSLRATNNKSRLFNDSYIEYEYIPNEFNQAPGTIVIDGEKELFRGSQPCDATQDNFSRVLGPIEGRIISYSGSHWTEQLAINGITIYNLTDYGTIYQSLGDPFVIGVPLGVLNTGPNSYSLRTADGPGQNAECSPFNKLLYTAIVNSTIILDQVYPEAEGCTWTVNFPEENRTISLPQGYSGANTCAYQPGNLTYDGTDAWQVIGYQLFSSFDVEPLGGDNVLDIDFQAHDINVDVELIQDIPYMWGPAILEVVVWQ